MNFDPHLERAAVAAAASGIEPLASSIDCDLGAYAELVRLDLGCRVIGITIAGQFAMLFSRDVRSAERLEVRACAEGDDLGVPGVRAGGSDGVALTDPLVAADLGFAFYAGLPLYLASGERLGSLAALDSVERHLSTSDLAVLRLLAAVIVQIAEFRLSIARRGVEAVNLPHQAKAVRDA